MKAGNIASLLSRRTGETLAMTHRWNHRSFALGAIALMLCIAPVAAEEPLAGPALSPQFESKAQPVLAKRPATSADKPTAKQLRDRAARAEQAGDCEAAFSAYC